MGWCSGTEVFDAIVGIILEMDISENKKEELVKVVFVACEKSDWDCQDDSCYINNEIVNKVYRELHPDYFEEEW